MVGDTIERELAGQFPNEVIRASAGTGKRLRFPIGI